MYSLFISTKYMWFDKTKEYILLNDHFTTHYPVSGGEALYVNSLPYYHSFTEVTMSTFDIARLLLIIFIGRFDIKCNTTNDTCDWYSIKGVAQKTDSEYFRYFVMTEFVDDIEKNVIGLIQQCRYIRKNIMDLDTNNLKTLTYVLIRFLNIIKDANKWPYIIDDIKLIVRHNSG